MLSKLLFLVVNAIGCRVAHTLQRGLCQDLEGAQAGKVLQRRDAGLLWKRLKKVSVRVAHVLVQLHSTCTNWHELAMCHAAPRML